jgi:hypothetical protein
MTTSTIAPAMSTSRRARRRHKPRHVWPIIAGCVAAAAALSLVVYLLWPTWQAAHGINPSELPVSVGGTPFNIQRNAIRIKAQRHNGQQERIDLAFLYPSLAPPPITPTRTKAEDALDASPVADRIFLSLIAHHDALSPDERIRTVYPRYFNGPAQPLPGGLTQHTFIPESPYQNEDLFSSDAPAFVARCTRDADIRGTDIQGACLSDRRIGGADIVFRFPRSWLPQWQDVAGAMDDLVARVRGVGDH